jgi:hypothetical protein
MPSPINIIVALVFLARGGFDFPCPCGGDDESPSPAITTPRIGGPLPATTKITRTNAFSGLEPSKKHYTVQCKLKSIATYKDRSDATVRSQPLEIPIPKIAVNDGEMVTIQDTSTKTIIVARTNRGLLPITRDVWEGTKCEICVIGSEEGKVVVDVSAILQSANGGADNVELPAGKSARSVSVHNISGRMIEAVPLGEKTTASFEKGFGVEVVVTEAGE